MVSHPNPGPTGLLVVSRFRVDAAGRRSFLDAADRALAALAVQPGCLGASLGQATDDAELLLLRTEWEGVGAYRRALSAFDVKVSAIPLLSTALDEPSAFEVVRRWDGTGIEQAQSGLAADAGDVGLGAAAAAHVPPVLS